MKEGWEVKKLGEVCEVIAGQSPKSSFYNKDGAGLPFYQGKKLFSKKYILSPDTWTTKITKEAYKDDILMSVRAPVGPINFSTEKICIGRGLAAIRAKKGTNKDYIFYFLLHHENQIVGNIGAVFNSINKNQISNLEIMIPDSVPEQAQIVKTLDLVFAKLDRAKANLEQNLHNAKALFESKLNEVFSQRGEGWVEKRLGDVTTLYQGLAINKKTKHLLVEKSNLPLLRIKDLRNNTHEQYVSETGYPINSLVAEDEIIYTRTGNSLGLVFRGRKGILHNNSFKIIPNELLINDYLYWWLQHEAFTKKIFILASKAAQPDITHKLFKEQIISIPSIALQKDYFLQIEEINENITQLQTHYQQKLNNLEELKKSILEKAFRGEL